jgi:hypothetical protein
MITTNNSLVGVTVNRIAVDLDDLDACLQMVLIACHKGPPPGIVAEGNESEVVDLVAETESLMIGGRVAKAFHRRQRKRDQIVVFP